MLQALSISLINAYQKCARALLPSCCRFSPSCSEYAKQALLKYGFFAGALKAAARLLKCQPFSGKSGYDPLV
ncbi:MAG: membrane protein insertion efficiency factor YidD [Deltaproteobacteria bacterium]